MTIFKQCIVACLGILLSAPFLAPLEAPGIVYFLIAAGCAWGATWLYARCKYGPGVRIRPTLRIDE